jgi:hypothetical protein
MGEGEHINIYVYIYIHIYGYKNVDENMNICICIRWKHAIELLEQCHFISLIPKKDTYIHICIYIYVYIYIHKTMNSCTYIICQKKDTVRNYIYMDVNVYMKIGIFVYISDGNMP